MWEWTPTRENPDAVCHWSQHFRKTPGEKVTSKNPTSFTQEFLLLECLISLGPRSTHSCCVCFWCFFFFAIPWNSVNSEWIYRKFASGLTSCVDCAESATSCSGTNRISENRKREREKETKRERETERGRERKKERARDGEQSLKKDGHVVVWIPAASHTAGNTRGTRSFAENSVRSTENESTSKHLTAARLPNGYDL